MKLAGSRPRQAIPQEVWVLSLRVCLLCCFKPPGCCAEQLSDLLLIEIKGVMVFKENQAMARLAVLEQVGCCDCVLAFNPALSRQHDMLYNMAQER